MYTTKNKIRNVTDLKLAKERYYYKVRLNEDQALSSMNRFRILFIDSLKDSAKLYGQRLLIFSLMKLLKARSKKN